MNQPQGVRTFTFRFQMQGRSSARKITSDRIFRLTRSFIYFVQIGGGKKCKRFINYWVCRKKFMLRILAYSGSKRIFSLLFCTLCYLSVRSSFLKIRIIFIAGKNLV